MVWRTWFFGLLVTAFAHAPATDDSCPSCEGRPRQFAALRLGFPYLDTIRLAEKLVSIELVFRQPVMTGFSECKGTCVYELFQ